MALVSQRRGKVDSLVDGLSGDLVLNTALLVRVGEKTGKHSRTESAYLLVLSSFAARLAFQEFFKR
jgi:hypothetical protein